MNLCKQILESMRDGLKKYYKAEDKDFHKADPNHNSKSLIQTKKGWVGFSHRASYEFKLGDKIFEQDWDDEGKLSEKDLDTMPFKKRGTKPCKTDDDVKQSAKNFARYVS